MGGVGNGGLCVVNGIGICFAVESLSALAIIFYLKEGKYWYLFYRYLSRRRVNYCDVPVYGNQQDGEGGEVQAAGLQGLLGLTNQVLGKLYVFYIIKYTPTSDMS